MGSRGPGWAKGGAGAAFVMPDWAGRMANKISTSTIKLAVVYHYFAQGTINLPSHTAIDRYTHMTQRSWGFTTLLGNPVPSQAVVRAIYLWVF